MFELLLTVAVNACVDEGHLSAASLGQRLDVDGLTATLTGLLPLLLLQAINRPINTSVWHRPTTAEYLDVLRPTRPTITTPAMGSINGNQGDRWRCPPSLSTPIRTSRGEATVVRRYRRRKRNG